MLMLLLFQVWDATLRQYYKLQDKYYLHISFFPLAFVIAMIRFLFSKLTRRNSGKNLSTLLLVVLNNKETSRCCYYCTNKIHIRCAHRNKTWTDAVTIS